MRMLSAALEYAARGWAVFPVHGIRNGRCSCGKTGCTNAGKHPCGDLAPHGVKDATTDPTIVRRWWTRRPDANIGLATGERSGVLVLDIDDDKGRASLVRLESENAPLPPTARVRTGSGGEHVYFAYPGVHCRNRVGKLAPGLDVRCCGGYVILPPSLHISGRRYEWAQR